MFVIPVKPSMIYMNMREKLGTPMPLEDSQIPGLAVELMSRLPVTSESLVATPK